MPHSMITRRSFGASLGALGLAGLAARTSLARAASAYPVKPIRLVVPFAAGGAVDTVGRTLGERLSVTLGQTVIVDNRPGANANIGAEIVAKAAPDGYTLFVAANGIVTNNILYQHLSFDGLRDFEAISLLGYAPLVLVVPTASPFKSVKDLVDAGRAKPGDLAYGSAGVGSSGQLAGALMAKVGGFEALHVAYKGGAPALVDLIAGRLSFMLLNPLEVLPHIRAGRIRALAVSAAERVPMLPGVPTMAEAGYPKVDATVWWVLLGPKGVPADIVKRLNADTTAALADAGVRNRLGNLGATITPSSPAQAEEFLKSESSKWADVIRSAHIHAD